ncbi:centrobin-like isoform X2 [Lytechinus variegatus]|uniref:centrobin-like isoform X2 n=1 Tax=Lytechinus variegatus TaxID=7654 RepID=UPI001BB19BD4|nr:centrobin-like isoform X2 [Lytechinus variegatus]
MMNLARIKSALDGIQDASLHSIAETMSGIEPLGSSTNASTAGSPRDASSKLSMRHLETDAARTSRDSLFSPIGEAKHEPVVHVGGLADSRFRKSASEPLTGEKDWRLPQDQRDVGEDKYDQSQRTKNVRIATTSETLVNRALFVKESHMSSGTSVGDESKPCVASHPSSVAAMKKLSDVAGNSGFDGTTYRYNSHSDMIDIEQCSPHDAFSIFSSDTGTNTSRYQDTTLTASVGSRISQGQDESVPGILSSQQQPLSSSPRFELHGLPEGRSKKEFENHQSIPAELAEIETLRQNLSNMITSPGLSQDESLSELLMLDKERAKRQSTESNKTDSLLGAQVFQGISPSSLRPGSDSGLASYQLSHVTSTQRSGVSTVESSITQENRVLREGLERERCRRKHCEDQIATLQGRILETQQLLAVAQATEKKKDNMIAQLDKTMAKVSASLKQREQEKVAMVDKLKAANDALLQEIEKQKIVIREQNRELVASKQRCEDFKQSERAMRDQLKQHQAENSKRWEEAQKMAQLTNKQMESMGEDCLKVERQLKQVQTTLASEREEWKQKEDELEQKFSSLETERTASFDEMQRQLQEEKRTVDELKKDLVKVRREADESRKEKESALREKEKSALELSLEKARWEAKLQKQEAEIQDREGSRANERMEKMKREAEEMEEMLREGQRKQVSEMSERHMEELRVQKDVHQREMMQREQRWADKQHQYQTRLAECQQEILKLNTKIEKVQQQRFGIVSKLQHFLQSQCNEAVMMVSSLEKSPQTPVNVNGHVTGERGYARQGARGLVNQGQKVKSAVGPYTSIEGQHAEQLKRAQEEARQAIQRLYLEKQEEFDEDAPHEASSFYPLEAAPSTPTNSEVSQSTVYHDIDASHLQTSHSTGNQPNRQSWPVDQRLPATPNAVITNGVMMHKGMLNGTLQRLDTSHLMNGIPAGDEMESGWMGVDQSDTGPFLEMMTSERQDTKIEQDIGWMSQHNSTLTSSPTKDGPSDYYVQSGQGLSIHIPGTLATSSNSQVKGHNTSDLSTGPLDMLDSPVSSTQGDFREIALQKYIAKLLEQSPGSVQQDYLPQRNLPSSTGKTVIEKERLQSGIPHVAMEHPQRGSSDVRTSTTTKTCRQVVATSRGMVSKDKIKKQAGPPIAGPKSAPSRPRPAMGRGQETTGNPTKSSQRTKVWR